MNGVDLQASVSNLSQMDRHQQDSHRSPIVNQQQNAETAREEAAKRVNMPVQPDVIEGKIIDPENRRRNLQERRKKKKKEQARVCKQNRGNGFIIDIQA
jgi:hypothetical protein